LDSFDPCYFCAKFRYQQTEVERRASELRALASARTVFQTYQLNNAPFNAIKELSGEDTKAAQQLRIHQMNNYEFGLSAIEKVLPDSDKANIPSKVEIYDGSVDVQTKMAELQKRINLLPPKLDQREKVIHASADTAKRKSLWFYVGLSLLSIVGAICKAVDKLSVALP